MSKLELTQRIDLLRHDIEKMMEKPRVAPKEKAALTEILQLLSEAADVAEESGL